MKSINPATGDVVFECEPATAQDVQRAKERALQAFSSWKNLSVDARAEHLRQFAKKLTEKRNALAMCISEEMGKPLWESLTEVQAMINKVEISIEAYKERCLEKREGQVATRFSPYGLVAVFGPYNFPGHLPNGHIVPALLAGNTVLFKPSELTPKVGHMTFEIWKESGLPEGVLNILQGPKEVAAMILQLPEVAGVYFTGSVAGGMAISEQSQKFPFRILALEMGGNNPLIVSKVADKQAAIYQIIQSAFLTSGQRCSCARRLIVLDDTILEALVKAARSLVVGAYTDTPEPFMGPVVSKQAADRLEHAYQELLARGGVSLLPLERFKDCFIKPTIVDMTKAKKVDEELFGPLLQVIRVKDLKEAIVEANNTAFGLAAGLLSDDPAEYAEVYEQVKAGCINWNTPTTGASSRAPFGGLGLSGNHRPAGYLSCDYCAYPVASQEQKKVALPEKLLPGVTLL